MAPDANIVVYQAPNTESGYADAFFAAASQNLADTVSSSWGESETLLQASAATGGADPAYAQAFDEAFLELAAQGQSTFVAAGNAGAYDASGDIGTTNLSVNGPDDSPFVTSVGGTTLNGTITAKVGGATVKATIPAQRTWGWDWLWPDYAKFGYSTEAAFAAAAVAGGGGGYSSFEPAPLYQEMLDQQRAFNAGSYSAVQYLTPPTTARSTGSTCPRSGPSPPRPRCSGARDRPRAARPGLTPTRSPATCSTTRWPRRRCRAAGAARASAPRR